MKKKSSKRNCETIAGPSDCATVSNEIDKISQLPDDVLHYILSFTTIVDMVRLSVLSRRWKSLWLTMPYLDFNFTVFSWKEFNTLRSRSTNEIYRTFEDLISWVLMSQGSTNITRFRFIWDNILDAEKLTRWIHIAMRRNVQQLELSALDIDGIETFQLPSCLFTSESLQVLSLTLPNCVLQLPNHLNFKQLKSLHLEQIELTDEKLINRLLKECSSLEDLSLIGCIVLAIKVVDISSSSLKCLNVSYNLAFSNDCGFSDCELRISCPNLLSLTCLGAAAKNYHLDNVSSLDNIHIKLYDGKEECREKEIAQLTWKILEHVKDIRVLTIDMDNLYLSIDELRGFSTMFCKLKVLTINTEIDKPITQQIFLFLNRCPNLESLTLDNLEINPEDFTGENEHWQLHDKGNAYWENNVKMVQLINFSGNKNELEFIKFMLKNGIALEKFIIFWSRYLEKKRVTDKTILKIPKSSHVEVKVIWNPL